MAGGKANPQTAQLYPALHGSAKGHSGARTYRLAANNAVLRKSSMMKLANIWFFSYSAWPYSGAV